MKKRFMTGFIFLNCVFIIGWGIGLPCMAEENFPTKPISMVVGYSAGGPADLTSRALAQVGSEVLGQPIIVVNKPGGGSAVAYAEFKNARPDGYTIAYLSTGAIFSALMREVPYHIVNDFDPIIHCTLAVTGIAVRSDSQFKTLKDLIAYAQANPGKIKYATGGAGTSQHLVMEMLADSANVKWTHVPFDGSMESITQLLGGHVDCVSETSLWKPHVTSGRLRLLATCGKTRMEAFPEVPTLVEVGYNIITPAYVGYAVPKGVPKERIKILHDAFYKAMFNDPRYVEMNKKFDQELFYLNSDDAKKRLKELYESSGKVIKGLKK